MINWDNSDAPVMVEYTSHGDPLVELIRKLHESGENGTSRQEIYKIEAAKLLRECRFDEEMGRQAMEEFKAYDKINIEEFIKKLDEVDKSHGKRPLNGSPLKKETREMEPIVANPGLFGSINPQITKVKTVDPWTRTLSKLSLTPSMSSESNKIDIDGIMVTFHELAGTLFRYVSYKIETSYGTCYGDGSEVYVNSVVTRRYSDFAWLHNYLIGKYNFRAVPSIPPKQLVMPMAQSEIDVADERIPGLHAFLIASIMHPVIAKDPTFRAFLTHPSSFSDWRTTSPEVEFVEEYFCREENIGENEQLDTSVIPKLADDPFFDDSKQSLESLMIFIGSTRLTLLNLSKYMYAASEETERLLLAFK